MLRLVEMNKLQDQGSTATFSSIQSKKLANPATFLASGLVIQSKMTYLVVYMTDIISSKLNHEEIEQILRLCIKHENLVLSFQSRQIIIPIYPIDYFIHQILHLCLVVSPTTPAAPV